MQRLLFFLLFLILAAGSIATQGLAADCPRAHAPYRVNWSANMSNERLSSGEPSLAYASSPLGPALPVELHWGGSVDRFTFDHPRVAPEGWGALEIEQDLARSWQYTTTRILFDRAVVRAELRIEGVDRAGLYQESFSDTLEIRGRHRHFRPVFPVVAGGAGRSEFFEEARREVMTRLGRDISGLPGPGVVRPSMTGRNGTVSLRFPAPVEEILIRFGTDIRAGREDRAAQDPGRQRIRLTDLTFCVPFGSRPGD